MVSKPDERDPDSRTDRLSALPSVADRYRDHASFPVASGRDARPGKRNSDFKTLTLEIYYAKMLSGQYGNPWELIFPAVLVSIIPIIIVFLSLQKYFVKGVSDGAVKM